MWCCSDVLPIINAFTFTLQRSDNNLAKIYLLRHFDYAKLFVGWILHVGKMIGSQLRNSHYLCIILKKCTYQNFFPVVESSPCMHSTYRGSRTVKIKDK